MQSILLFEMIGGESQTPELPLGSKLRKHIIIMSDSKVK